MSRTDKLLIAIIILIGVFALTTAVMAEGPEYIKGQGSIHNTTCTPPTSRAPNADGVQVPLDLSELDHATVSLYAGGDLFTSGTLIDGPIDTDINCTHLWIIDDYPAGQKYVFATATDTDNRTSEVSVEGGPFSSLLPLMPPAPPETVR